MYLQFWKAFGMYITGGVGQVPGWPLSQRSCVHEASRSCSLAPVQAIPLLRSFSSDDLVGPACLATLLHAANASHITDSYGLAETLENERISASDEALLLLASVQWHCNDLEAGLLTLDQLEDSAAPDNVQRSGKAVNAWILLAQAGIAKDGAVGQPDDSEDDEQDAASNIAEAQSIFRVILATEPSHIDVSLDAFHVPHRPHPSTDAPRTIMDSKQKCQALHRMRLHHPELLMSASHHPDIAARPTSFIKAHRCVCHNLAHQ